MSGRIRSGRRRGGVFQKRPFRGLCTRFGRPQWRHVSLLGFDVSEGSDGEIGLV